MNPLTVQSEGREIISALMREGDAAYEAVLAQGGSGYDAAGAYLETVTALRAKLNGDDELWLCPACRKTLTPVDTLCVYCESEEHDHLQERRARLGLRHGG